MVYIISLRICGSCENVKGRRRRLGAALQAELACPGRRVDLRVAFKGSSPGRHVHSSMHSSGHLPPFPSGVSAIAATASLPTNRKASEVTAAPGAHSLDPLFPENRDWSTLLGGGDGQRRFAEARNLATNQAGAGSQRGRPSLCETIS